MDVYFPYLTPSSTLKDAALALSRVKYKITAIPVIEESLELIAMLQTANLREFLVKEAKNYTHNTSAFVDIKELNDIPLGDPFWVKKIDLDSIILNVDKSPFTVLENISVGKLHFLFSMLGLHYLFVLNHERLVGMITIESFQEFK